MTTEPAKITESVVEQTALDWFSSLGWQTAFGPDISPEGSACEREDHDQVVLVRRLQTALRNINPNIPPDAIDEAIRKITRTESPSLIENNRRFHRMMTDGVDVEFHAVDGRITHDKVWLLDLEDLSNNDWLAVNQFTVIEDRRNRRPDIVIFVNGLPLGVIELKNPTDEKATIQKFLPDAKGRQYPELSARRNIVVIADEAHRSQYDFIDGFARHMHDALPNASFIGFTGTPIERGDRSTPAVFGDYIDKYDILRAVEDGATVPIYYEGRLAKIDLREEEKPKIDPEFEEITEGEEESDKQKLRSKWAALETMVGTEKRVGLVAEDLVQHFEDRLEVLDGKAMIVCMSRRICVEMYNAICVGADDYPPLRLRAEPTRRIAGIAAAMEHILQMEDGKKRYLREVSALSKAFALAVPHKESLKIRDEVGFFQEVRAGLAKATVEGEGKSPDEMDTAIRQLISRAVASEEVIEELIDLAKEMQEARRRGEDLGMSDDEVAFYDALEVNDSAVQVLGDETLKTIAQELVTAVRRSVTIDWTVRENARAQIRVIVKRILRKYGYPPDKQEKATQTVLEQAEVLCKEWVV